MLPQDLDYYFPFFVCLYGIFILLVLYSPALVEVAEKNLPKSYLEQFLSRAWLGWVCLVVGGFWSIQHLL